ncbi:class I SAM-dependent methyltransferase [Breoghania sp. L-A4]|nr:class I SAM-dependent methyltransferase [Breoghania sp. L-A4]
MQVSEAGEYVMNPAWDMRRDSYFNFLRTKGLDEDTRLLDIGCGAMPLGHAAIPFFEGGSGRYFAADISQKTIDVARDLLRQKELSLPDKHISISDNFDWPDDWAPVDLAFSNSLFSHLTLNAIYLCLVNVYRVMKPGGVYYSTFFLCPDDHDQRHEFKIGGLRLKLWADAYCYKFAAMEAIAHAAGFEFSLSEKCNLGEQVTGTFSKRA